MSSRMKILLTTIFAGIESYFLDLATLKDWADRCIDSAAQPCDWIIDLSLASSREHALNVLRETLPRFEVTLNESYGELLVGFWYLRFSSHEVVEREFLTELIDVIDAYQLKELDGEEIAEDRLSDSAKNLVVPWAKVSQENLKRILELRFTQEEAIAIGLV